MYDIYVRLDSLDEKETEDKVLWAPGLEDMGYVLYSATLDLQLNHSGKLTFQMSPKHPLYGRIRKRLTRVIVRRNGSEIWRGRVLDSKKDFYNRQIVVCEGALSYLLDTTMRHYTFKGTLKEYVEYALGIHNDNCDEDKKIHIGNITAVDETTEISISETNQSEAYPSTLDELNDRTVSQYGGYLKIRKDEENVLRLDYLSGSGRQINQQIRFGKNLLDLEDYITAENVCSRCIPLGATLREIEEFKKYQDSNYVSELDEADADKRLDLTSLINRDYLENSTSVSLFGKVTRCVVFENIVTTESLFDTAQNWLENEAIMNTSIEIKAIDLSLLLEDIEAIEDGVSVEIVSPPHELDMFMLCSKVALNILSPGETSYTFGSGFNCLSDQQAKSLRQSAKAFGTAKGNTTSVRNIAATVSGQYLTASEFNAFKEELDGSLEDIESLPTPTELDNGKVLKIIDGEWVKAEEAELPAVTDTDNGKVLKVVAGQWVMADADAAANELPEIAAEDEGKVLKIVGGQWTKADDNAGEPELPPVTEEHEGMILKVVDGKWTAVAVE